MSDEEIVGLIIVGDKDKFIQLYRKYEIKLLNYIKRFIYNEEDAIDVLQNVFVKSYENLNSFDRKLKFNSWIYRIAHNESINYFKKHGKHSEGLIEMDIVFPVLFAKEKSDQLSINNENKKMFENLLGELDIKYREILILTFWEELSYEEIGDILKIPTSTVGVRLRRAKENLLKIIDKNNLDKNLLINN